MLGLVVRRLAHAIVSFAGITLVVFTLIHLAPGDPVQRYLGGIQARNPSPELVAQLRAELRLDKPLLVQYGHWLGRASTLDFGRSFVDRKPVSERISSRVPATLLLNGTSMLLALLIAVPIGVASAAKAHGRFDQGSRLVLLMIYSIPSFLGAILLLEVFAVRLEVLPLFGMRSSPSSGVLDLAHHMVLPVVALTYGQLVLFARFTRGAMLESLGKAFVPAARARGLSARAVLVRHALRNSLIPIVSLMSVVVPFLLSGSVVVERIFRWNGLGNLFFESVVARDYPTVMGLTIVTAVLVLLTSVAADLLYAWLDPRIREGEGNA